MTVEDAAEHELPHRPARSQILLEEARGVVDDLRQQVGPPGGLHLALEALDAGQELALLLAVAGVDRDRQPELDTSRPVRDRSTGRTREAGPDGAQYPGTYAPTKP